MSFKITWNAFQYGPFNGPGENNALHSVIYSKVTTTHTICFSIQHLKILQLFL